MEDGPQNTEFKKLKLNIFREKSFILSEHLFLSEDKAYILWLYKIVKYYFINCLTMDAILSVL